MSLSCHVKADRLVSPVYHNGVLKYIEYFKSKVWKNNISLFQWKNEKSKPVKYSTTSAEKEQRKFSCYISFGPTDIALRESKLGSIISIYCR